VLELLGLARDGRASEDMPTGPRGRGGRQLRGQHRILAAPSLVTLDLVEVPYHQVAGRRPEDDRQAGYLGIIPERFDLVPGRSTLPLESMGWLLEDHRQEPPSQVSVGFGRAAEFAHQSSASRPLLSKSHQPPSAISISVFRSDASICFRR